MWGWGERRKKKGGGPSARGHNAQLSLAVKTALVCLFSDVSSRHLLRLFYIDVMETISPTVSNNVKITRCNRFQKMTKGRRTEQKEIIQNYTNLVLTEQNKT